MRFDDRPTDRQAKAHASRRYEWLEQAKANFLRHAGPVIGNRDLDDTVGDHGGSVNAETEQDLGTQRTGPAHGERARLLDHRPAAFEPRLRLAPGDEVAQPANDLPAPLLHP